MSEQRPSPEERIDTGGGAVVKGNVTVERGDFVGRDKIILTEESAYDVQGLPNPYPGLNSYTYEARAAFAGREAAVQEAVKRLANPAGRQVLTFITGVSGSGKSSFAQAGLLPALEAYYAGRNKRAGRAVFKPSSSPLALLADALAQLGLPEPAPTGLTPQEFSRTLSASTPPGQVNLLVIDQFEELFSQAPPEQSRQIFDLLENLPPFDQGNTHILATLRSDYLEELFNHAALWEIAVHGGVELRAMSASELQAAILGPLQARAREDERYRLKRFEPGLLDRLAQDAAGEPSYLPLLQVSLQELWVGGSLKLERYQGLAGAIEGRAEKVYAFLDYDQPAPQEARPPEQQAELIALLVDLVNISLDDDPRRNVRRRRTKAALEKSSPLRPDLIDDLVAARLLSAGTENSPQGPVETVDIIHETVLQKWGRLREAIGEQRELLRRRARFEQELSAWLASGRSEDYLLSGAHLKEARLLGKDNDIVLQGQDARDFVQGSDRLFLALQKVPVLQRLFLWVTVGGALGFSLAYGITYFLQAEDKLLLPFLMLMELVLGAILTAIYSLGLVLPVLRRQGMKRSWLLLAAGLTGGVAFAPIVLLSDMLSAQPYPLFLVEGVLWGAVAGASVAWALTTRRPAWQAWAVAALASGFALAGFDAVLALMIGASYRHVYQRPNISNLPAEFWLLVFLAGALVPLAMLLAARLGRVQAAYRELVE